MFSQSSPRELEDIVSDSLRDRQVWQIFEHIVINNISLVAIYILSLLFVRKEIEPRSSTFKRLLSPFRFLLPPSSTMSDSAAASLSQKPSSSLGISLILKQSPKTGGSNALNHPAWKLATADALKSTFGQEGADIALPTGPALADRGPPRVRYRPTYALGADLTGVFTNLTAARQKSRMSIEGENAKIARENQLIEDSGAKAVIFLKLSVEPSLFARFEGLHPDVIRDQTENNARALWDKLNAYAASNTSISALKAMSNAINEFHGVQMLHDETMHFYTQRFNTAVAGAVARIVGVLPEFAAINTNAMNPYLAWRFLEGMDPRRYGDILDRLSIKADNPSEAADIPTTVAAMATLCLQQECTDPSQSRVNWANGVKPGSAPTGSKPSYQGTPCTNQLCISGGRQATHGYATCNREGGGAYKQPKDKSAAARGNGGRGNDAGRGGGRDAGRGGGRGGGGRGKREKGGKK